MEGTMATGQLSRVVRNLRALSLSANIPGLTDGQLLDLFISRRDETAFEALLSRHGAMVLGTCRRLLGNIHDAEDAFQATFLILVRKAHSVVPRDMVGNWLYGVACRTALRVRTAAVKRRAKESKVPGRQPATEHAWSDLLPILDTELKALPDKYRAAVVLCDLEGKSRTVAARQLGLAVGTLSTRVARGRALLARKLVRHGMIFSSAALAVTLAATPTAACVPPLLFMKTVQAVAGYAASELAAGVVSAKVAALMEGVLKTMFLNKLKLATAMLLAVTMIGTAVGYFSGPLSATGEASVPAGAEAPRQAADEPVPDDRTSWRTENFLVDAPTAEIARQVGAAAERQRKEIARAWLGKELASWASRCPVHVKITAGRGQGVTSFTFAGGKVLSQRMDLNGSLRRILQAELPRQITHVVLADFFKHPVPRWAGEGAAMFPDPEEQARLLKALPEVLYGQDRFVPLQRLFIQPDYPADLQAFRAESYSVTNFLVAAPNPAELAKNKRAFIWFVSQGLRDGWEEAVRTHYNYASVKELERAWLRSVAQGAGSAPRRPAQVPGQTHGAFTDDLTWRVLGLRLEAVGASAVVSANKQLQGGMKVTAVRPRSTAAGQNLRSGDIILGLHQWETLNSDNIRYTLAYCQGAGMETVRFFLVRNNKVREGSFSLKEDLLEGPRKLAIDDVRQEIRTIMRKMEDCDRETLMAILVEIETAVKEVKKKLQEKDAP
jgi:RNA polymerase sigma factor (sigma-70 family)